MDTKTKRLIFSVESYYVCTPQGFVTEYFQIFIIDEVKNFATNKIYLSCWSQSHTQDLCKGSITNWKFVHQGKDGYYKIKSNWVLEQRFNSKLVFWDRPRAVSKISHTYNRLIVDQWIHRSSDFKITRQSFCLVRFSPFVNKLPCLIYFPLYLVYLVICWCLHDLHVIWHN